MTIRLEEHLVAIQRYTLGEHRINGNIAKAVLRDHRFTDVPEIGRGRLIGVELAFAVISGLDTPGLAP